LLSATGSNAQSEPDQATEAQREIGSLKARNALAAAVWQDRLSQVTRTLEDELAALRARVARAEADAQQAREALARAEQDKAVIPSPAD